MSSLRQLDGQLRLLEAGDPLAYSVELWLVNDADNRNRERFVNLAGHLSGFYGAPLLVAYTRDGKQVGDGHNFDWTRDAATGDEYPSFTAADAERIVGILSEDAADFRLEQDGEKTWAVGRGKLWAWYARELVEKIRGYAEQGRSLPVSIEALVYESYMDGDIEVETEYEILGVTILGEHVAPAVAGARIVKLQEARAQMGALKLRAASIYEEAARDKEKEGKRMGYSEEQLAALGEKFPGYRVLAAESVEGAVWICLSADDGAFARYIMESEDAPVDPEAIERVAPQLAFAFDDAEVRVESAAAMSGLLAAMEGLHSDVERLTAERDTASGQLEQLRTWEMSRRSEAAKAKVLSVLAAFNQNREISVDADRLDEQVEAAQNGAYNDCVSEDGRWIGEAAVERDVLAVCAAVDMEQRSKLPELHQWRVRAEKPAAEGVEGLLQRKGIM